MPHGSIYGQASPSVIRDQDNYINIASSLRKYPDFRLEVLKRLNGGVFSKTDTVPKSHKIEWSAKPNKKMSSTLSTAYTSGTTLIVNDPGVFNVDQVIQIAGKQAVVTQVDSGINVSFKLLPGETLSAQDAGTAVDIVSGGTPVGKDADNMITHGFDDYYNYAGNFEDVVDVSTHYDASDVRGYEKAPKLIARKKQELMYELNRALVLGKRGRDQERDSYYMGGVKNMIDTYAPANAIDFGGSSVWSGATVDRDVQDKLDAVFTRLADKAFEKPVMWVSPSFMAKFKHIQSSNSYTEGIPSGTKGIGVVRKYKTHAFGDIDVVQLLGQGVAMDDTVIITDESDIGYKPLVNWRTYELGRKGQSKQWQVEGIFHFMMGIPEAHAYLYNLGL